MFAYQVNCLLYCNNIVRAFWTDPSTMSSVDDCVMNIGLNSARKHNPFIVCQILETYAFVLGSRMGHWQDCIEGSGSEWRRRYLRVLRRVPSREQDSGRVSGHSETTRLRTAAKYAMGGLTAMAIWESLRPRARGTLNSRVSASLDQREFTFGHWTHTNEL